MILFIADVFEEVLEIVSYMTFYSPTISLEMWSLWPLIMDALGDWAIDFFDSKALLFYNINYCCSFEALFLAHCCQVLFIFATMKVHPAC